MNPYAFLPLIGFFANLGLALYILKKNAANLTNRLYGLAALSLAIWSIGDYLNFSARSLQDAFFWDKISSLGSSLTAFFLLFFFLHFTKNKFSNNKLFTMLLFLPALFFIISDFLFNTLSKSIRAEWWGYRGINGDLFGLYILYLVAYIAIGIYLSYKFNKKTRSPNEKKQTILMIIALSIPLGGGILTEAIPRIFGFAMIPLTTTLTTCTALIIAYTIIKYKLMDISPAVAANTIIETMTDSLFVLGPDKIILMVNQSTCDYLGYKKDDLLGQPVNFMFTNQSFSQKDIFEELLKNRDKINNYRIAYLTKAKKEIPVSLNASAIKDAGNRIIGIVGIAQDITGQEKREVEISLKNQNIEKQNQAMLNILEDISLEKDKVAYERDKTNTILKSIGDGVMVVNQEQKIEFINPVAEELTGWPLKEAVGMNSEEVFNIFDEATMAKRQSPISEAMKTGRIKNLSNHTVLKTKDEQIIPIADSAAPIKDAQGNISGAILVFRDVIKERMAEEKLLMAKNQMEKLNIILEQKVDKRTKELQKAYDELMSLDKMKDEFLNISAHELKTPLTSIMGLSEIMILNKQGSINIKQKKSLTIVNNEANRLLNIIKKILGITRIEAGKAVFDLQETDLCPLASKMIDSLKPMAAKQKVRLICQKPDQPIWVKVDAERMQEVIYNLVDNALKFSPPNSKIYISGEIKNKVFIFSVKDQGPGIDPAKKDKLFQKFSQLDTGFSRKQEGTGLGLYISKKIIENMGGKIWAESEFGHGANFKFSLPLVKK
ncbi:MAG: hypothetical protein A2Y82_01940 [Candidatus Buchananbacteria bacterium RBG_13_36_9]|uniref:histidine kinase n=1 Tax=Candidatus Buchananbacteria bacterium RBG_13_36_9 TaxID=1797530 RepID=A0A1G1XNF5_9BACT|nr:MAG: hypothetical protein A2Y82_01940 [Candidatus Buchananbacteria bacterium RBG_13_36_9]